MVDPIPAMRIGAPTSRHNDIASRRSTSPTVFAAQQYQPSQPTPFSGYRALLAAGVSRSSEPIDQIPPVNVAVSPLSISLTLHSPARVARRTRFILRAFRNPDSPARCTLPVGGRCAPAQPQSCAVLGSPRRHTLWASRYFSTRQAIVALALRALNRPLYATDMLE